MFVLGSQARCNYYLFRGFGNFDFLGGLLVSFMRVGTDSCYRVRYRLIGDLFILFL